jgi:hypothetical protein
LSTNRMPYEEDKIQGLEEEEEPKEKKKKIIVS